MQKLSEYVPPKVWKWEKENNINRFSNINRPISGATSDKDLPKGQLCNPTCRLSILR